MASCCVCTKCGKVMHIAKCYPRHARPRVVWEGWPIAFGYLPWQALPGPLTDQWAWAFDFLFWRLYWPLKGANDEYDPHVS
jgi:hypothetical protein